MLIINSVGREEVVTFKVFQGRDIGEAKGNIQFSGEPVTLNEMEELACLGGLTNRGILVDVTIRRRSGGKTRIHWNHIIGIIPTNKTDLRMVGDPQGRQT